MNGHFAIFASSRKRSGWIFRQYARPGSDSRALNTAGKLSRAFKRIAHAFQGTGTDKTSRLPHKKDLFASAADIRRACRTKHGACLRCGSGVPAESPARAWQASVPRNAAGHAGA